MRSFDTLDLIVRDVPVAPHLHTQVQQIGCLQVLNHQNSSERGRQERREAQRRQQADRRRRLLAQEPRQLLRLVYA